MDYAIICHQITELSREIGAYLHEERKNLNESGVEIKGRNNFVTYIDKESERRLIDGLRQILPQAGFLTEEGSIEYHNEEYCWVIDPLDGTSNYIRLLPPYSVSIGLMKDKEIILGCVYEVTQDEVFYAWKGGKAWMNGKEIHVSTTDNLDYALIGFGVPYNVTPRFEFLKDKVRDLYGRPVMRLLGSAAAELCYVAAGRTDGYFHEDLSPWDVAAGSIILREAGGNITDLSGGDNYIFGRELLASNGYMHTDLQQFLKP